jgi:HD-GYP domain-containing protein (c-di-GMP phosphodiesterase class II)
MADFLRAHQLNIMLVLCGIIGVTALYVLITNATSRRRKLLLFSLEMEAFLIVFSDRFAYIYRGDVSRLGWWMVRITNFMVFFLSLAILLTFNLYLIDLLLHEGKLERAPRRLVHMNRLVFFGMVLLIVSQFTGLYYTFDDQNRYQRAPGFVICYLIPMVCMIVSLWVIVEYGKRLSPAIRIPVFLFDFAPLVAAVAQMFLYGLSLINLSSVLMTVVLYIFALVDMNHNAEKAHKQELEYLKEKQESMTRLFEQTSVALANAIDESKIHARGHSVRVADYARRIATLSGMIKDESERVYFAALLHDIGKLSVPDEILGKGGELTEEEQQIYRSHTTAGEHILAEISEYSYLSEGAHYHHERYDGKGYPDGLKGEEIPVSARIIAVADAYDAMTSYRDRREPLPQTRVREELVKEEGQRFDPTYTKAMLHLMEEDPDYHMRENSSEQADTLQSELYCDSYRSEVSLGISISENERRISLKCVPMVEGEGEFAVPALLLFDSLDGRVHTTEGMIEANGYTEYGEVWFDGHAVCNRARNMDTTVEEVDTGLAENEYEIISCRFMDHARVIVNAKGKRTTIIAALPDSTRYTYISLTGEHCHIYDINVEKTGNKIQEGDIPRIAEEITYIDRLESDVKNVQIDRYRSAFTTGVKVKEDLRLVFHTRSMPTASLVWHCPYVLLYSSDNGEVNGPNYREFVLIRFDGEIEDSGEHAENRMQVIKNDQFESWDEWKTLNKKGMECVVDFHKRGNRITTITENAGIAIKNITATEKDTGDVYVALTGDQCALTDIRIVN